MSETRAVTQLLGEWRSGDRQALDKLTPIVYEELRRLAHYYMRGERKDHTLQATGLVHEAFSRLAGAEVAWQDRAHFFAVAARLMRRILIDHAKARRSEKRGGNVRHTSFDDGKRAAAEEAADLLDIDDALERLSAVDARKSDALVLHYFGGLTHDEIAQALDISPATVDRDLRLAKAWMRHELRHA